MQDWKGIMEKTGEVNSTGAYIMNDESWGWIPQRVLR
jgi:hypothetical protein